MTDGKLLGGMKLTLLSILLLAAGCGLPIQRTAIPTETGVHPSALPSPTLEVSATATHGDTRTQPTPSWTPAPTLPPAEARTLVANLLSSNAGCRLPCWWGFAPGHTSWQTVESFVQPFALKVYVGDSAGEFTYATVKIPAPEGLSLYPNHDYTIQDGIVQAIGIFDPGPSPVFAFVEFVNTYGPPEEVWIRTYNEGVREVPPPFGTGLFYPGQGIVAAFDVEAVVGADKVRGCPQQGSRPALGLWSPDLRITFLEAADMFRWDHEEWAFRPLQEATGMDVETFFEVFSDPNNTSCLETPADLWTPQF